MKRSFEGVYHSILPKGNPPFVYLRCVVSNCLPLTQLTMHDSLESGPGCVGVGVHLTECEVHFLNEEEITERITDRMQQALAFQGQSKRFEYTSESCLIMSL